MKTKIFLVLIVFYNLVQAQVFEVKTTPAEAVVFAQKNGKSEPVKLGMTPLKLQAKEVFSQVGDQKTFMLKVEKDGFKDYQVMMVKTPGVDYSMEILLSVNEEIKTIKKHDLLMSELFKVQRLIRSNNFGDALEKLTALEKDYKEFSIITELKGITYYMQKDVNKALSMFRLAFSKNSKNIDAYKMKVYLEKKLGLEAEAGR